METVYPVRVEVSSPRVVENTEARKLEAKVKRNSWA
jgi:hypothetical protein